MDIVARLLLREEIDALEHELSDAGAAPKPDLMRILELKQEIARLEHRISRRQFHRRTVIG